MLRSLTNKDATELLGKNRLGRLGCILESGEPYIVPINYYFEDGVIYCHSHEGLKLSALRANPKACLQVDEIEDPFQWKSVIAFGEFEDLDDAVEQRRVLDAFLERFSRLTPADAVRLGNDPGEAVAYRIKIDRVTGRAES